MNVAFVELNPDEANLVKISLRTCGVGTDLSNGPSHMEWDVPVNGY